MRTAEVNGHTLEVIEIFHACGIDIPIVEATAEQLPTILVDSSDGKRLFGCFDVERMMIFVNAAQAGTVKRDTVTHEKIHAFIYVSGVAELLRFALGEKRAEKWPKIEEAIVRLLTPHIVAMGLE